MRKVKKKTQLGLKGRGLPRTKKMNEKKNNTVKDRQRTLYRGSRRRTKTIYSHSHVTFNSIQLRQIDVFQEKARRLVSYIHYFASFFLYFSFAHPSPLRLFTPLFLN